jgi:UDP-glucose 4-epimerase
MECIEDDKPLTIFGDGFNTRDFVSVNDVINAIQIAIKKINGKKGDVYNIGSGRHITISDLANLMVDISGKKLGIKHSKPKKGDIRFSQPSIALARRKLGYHPKILLRDGLKKLLEESTAR